MANPADSYDPLMMLDQFKQMGSPDAADKAPGDVSRFPGGVDQNDPTANLGTTTGYPMAIAPAQTTQTDNGAKFRPAGVDNYDPLNLPSPAPAIQFHGSATNPDQGSAGRP